MATYQIWSKGGADFGVFQGGSEAHALAAMHAAAGVEVRVEGGDVVFDDPEQERMAGGLGSWEVLELPQLSKAAQEAVEETGVNVGRDIQRLRAGRVTEAELLEECLDGADADREQGWREYVQAVALAAGV